MGLLRRGGSGEKGSGFEFFASFVYEALLAAICLYVIDAFAYLRFTPGEFVVFWLGIAAAILACDVASLYSEANARWRWLQPVFSVGIHALISPALKHPPTSRQLIYISVFFWIVLTIWNRWSTPAEESVLKEKLRRFCVLLGSVSALFPFITDRRLGGVDAVWYSNMLKDFLAQARSGVFPVFIGQDYEAYDGAIHPFRSGPMFLWVGGAWDWLTFHALGLFSLQHLVALSAAIFGGVSMYVCLNALAPRRRWFACLLAVVYIVCPGNLKSLYCDEMYMTWMAIAVMPLIIYGSTRVLLWGDVRGWTLLAGGLAALWMCHPPVALWTMLCVAMMQTACIASRTFLFKDGFNILRAAGWFLLLSLYYFVSMSETPPSKTTGTLGDLLGVVGLLLILAGGVGGVFRRNWLWIAAIFPGGFLIWRCLPDWLPWAGAMLVVFFALRLINRGPFFAGDPSASIRAAIVAFGLACTFAWYYHHAQYPSGTGGDFGLLGIYGKQWENFFLPVSRNLDQASDSQPGLVLWAALVLSLGSFFVRASRVAAGILVCTAVVVIACFIRIPAWSDFLVGYAPRHLAPILNFPLILRLLPACLAIIVFAAYLSWEQIEGRTLYRVCITAFSIGAVGYSAAEVSKFWHRGVVATSSHRDSKRILLSENMKVERFVYDLLPSNRYFSNNATDGRIESRLLASDNSVLYGPDQMALESEKGGPVETLNLYEEKKDKPNEWHPLGPRLTVPAGEDLFLHFTFFPTVSYKGVLIFSSTEGDYREYLLDNPGFENAFGVGGSHSSVLTIWNSTDQPAHYRLIFLSRDPQAPPAFIDNFARLTVSHFAAVPHAIELKSFVPYHAEVRIEKPAVLETPRVFLPGYRAIVDGVGQPLIRSQQGLVALAMNAGKHDVIIRFVGTPKLRLAAWISGLGWLIFIVTRFSRRDEPDEMSVRET